MAVVPVLDDAVGNPWQNQARQSRPIGFAWLFTFDGSRGRMRNGGPFSIHPLSPIGGSRVSGR